MTQNCHSTREKKNVYLHLGVWLKTLGQLRPIFDQWGHCTPLACAGPVPNWNQTSCFCIGEHKGCTWNILSYPLRMAGQEEQPDINYSINAGNEQKEREHCQASAMCLTLFKNMFAFYYILKTIIWDRYADPFHIWRMRQSLNIYWTLSPKPTHDLFSWQWHIHVVWWIQELSGESVLHAGHYAGTELNIHSPCFKARSSKSVEGKCSL